MSPQDLSHLIATYLPEPHAGLLSGMLFGTKETLSKELTDALITTGTLHIVALSGTNITILTKIMGSFLGVLISRRVASVLTIGLIIGFVLFTGASPSVVRAAIMGSTTLIGIAVGRPVWALWSWFIAAVSMVAFDFRLLGNVSYQLSVGAALGMILFSGENSRNQGTSSWQTAKNGIQCTYDGRQNTKNGLSQWAKRMIFSIIPYPFIAGIQKFWQFCTLSKVLCRLRFVLKSSLRTTLAAQLFTIPIIFLTFHRLSIISPIPNLFIGWVLEPLTAVGMVTVIAGLVFYPLGQIGAWLLWPFLEYIIRVVMIFSTVPLASVGF